LQVLCRSGFSREHWRGLITGEQRPLTLAQIATLISSLRSSLKRWGAPASTAPEIYRVRIDSQRSRLKPLLQKRDSIARKTNNKSHCL